MKRSIVIIAAVVASLLGIVMSSGVSQAGVTTTVRP